MCVEVGVNESEAKGFWRSNGFAPITECAGDLCADIQRRFYEAACWRFSENVKPIVTVTITVTVTVTVTLTLTLTLTLWRFSDTVQFVFDPCHIPAPREVPNDCQYRMIGSSYTSAWEAGSEGEHAVQGQPGCEADEHVIHGQWFWPTGDVAGTLW